MATAAATSVAELLGQWQQQPQDNTVCGNMECWKCGEWATARKEFKWLAEQRGNLKLGDGNSHGGRSAGSGGQRNAFILATMASIRVLLSGTEAKIKHKDSQQAMPALAVSHCQTRCRLLTLLVLDFDFCRSWIQAGCVIVACAWLHCMRVQGEDASRATRKRKCCIVQCTV